MVWVELPGGVSDELIGLAGRCSAADGGLPLAADPALLGRRWAAAEAVRFGVRDDAGALVAAGVVRPAAAAGAPVDLVYTGLVDPAARGRGLGAGLLDRGLGMARSGVFTVETESLTAEAAVLFGSRGLRQVFAEDVMRIELGGTGVAAPDWAAGATLTAWSADSARRFFALYEAAFRERPGFPGMPAAEWIADNEEDDEFRADWSCLVSLPESGDAGFITCAVGWIVQVGVLPAARGRGLGEALVREALSRMTAAGAAEAWLDVNVNNPGAGRLYRRLGFSDRGTRARFRRS